MKKGKSQGETLIHKFSFSVYPFSIFFSQKLSSKYTLYFEKSFQILGRFSTPYLQNAANQLLYFQNPDKISSFRITTEKNLQYQWSLYSGNNALHQEHQQHIETLKINLQEFWNNFQSSKDTVKEYRVKFNNVKCELTFLVAVGSQKQILQSIQSTSRQAINEGELESHLSSEKQQTKQSLLLLSPERKKVASNEQKQNQSGSNFHLNPPKIQIEEQAIQNIEGLQGQKIILPLTALNKTNSIIYSIKKPEDNARLLESPEKNISLISRNDISAVDSAVYSQLRLQLTLSEVEIGRQIEQRLKASGLHKVSDDLNNQVSQVMCDSQNKIPTIEDALLDKYRKTKSKRITSSQLLNHRGEIIVTPFYYHAKYFLIIFVIIAIFTGLIYLNPKSQFSSHIHTITYDTNKSRQKGSRKTKSKKRVK